MAPETAATPHNGQDIFSALLLLALSGNEIGREHFLYFQKEGMENDMENMGSIPSFQCGILASPNNAISIPEEGGDNPPSSLLIPPLPAGEKEMEKSPVGPGGPLEPESLQGAQILKDAVVSDEKPDPCTLMTPYPVIARDEVPPLPPVSHVIKEGVRGDIVSPPVPSSEGDHLLMQHDPLQLPSGERAPRSENEPPFLHGLNKFTELFREGDHRNNFNMDSDGREDRRWIEGAEIMTSIKKPASIDNNTDLRPLYKYIEPEKMMQQLSQRLIHASHLGSHTARIRLKPEELGELSMDISVMDNSVKAVVSVDSNDVKEIIEANLHKLGEELKNHGLRIEEFTVAMRGGGAEDRSMSAHGREETVGGKRNGRIAVDNKVDQEGLNIPVTKDNGEISIFA